MSDGAGVSEQVSIELCGNGQFSYYANSQVGFGANSGDLSTGNQKSNTGYYEIKFIANNSYLVLTFSQGDVYEYSLSSNTQGYTFLDKNRYILTSLESCY